MEKTIVSAILSVAVLFNNVSIVNAATINYGGVSFTVDDEIKFKYPDLIKLILESESIDNDGKQHWLDTLIVMTPEQTDQLFSILSTEKREIQKLNSQFERNDRASEAYENGDYENALTIYRSVAYEGEKKAQYMLGLMYFEGKGVEQNYALAKLWWEEAAAQDCEYAINGLKKLKDMER